MTKPWRLPNHPLAWYREGHYERRRVTAKRISRDETPEVFLGGHVRNAVRSGRHSSKLGDAVFESFTYRFCLLGTFNDGPNAVFAIAAVDHEPQFT